MHRKHVLPSVYRRRCGGGGTETDRLAGCGEGLCDSSACCGGAAERAADGAAAEYTGRISAYSGLQSAAQHGGLARACSLLSENGHPGDDLSAGKIFVLETETITGQCMLCALPLLYRIGVVQSAEN